MSKSHIVQDNLSEIDIINFSLTTPTGVLSYKTTPDGNYTDFIRIIIELLLSVNSSEIDHQLTKNIRKALNQYDNNEFENEDDSELGNEEEEETDYALFAIEDAKNQAKKYKEASKLISNLPPSDKLQMRILSYEAVSNLNIERKISKYTDLPPNEIHEILHNHKPFILDFDKSKDLYVELRMLDVILTIKPLDSNIKSEDKLNKKHKTPPSVKNNLENIIAGKLKNDCGIIR